MRLRIVQQSAPTAPRSRRKYTVHVVLVAITVAVAATFTAAVGYGHRSLSAFPVPDRPAYVPAPDPIASAVAGLPPNSTNGHLAQPSPAIHTIDVRPNTVRLLVAGKAVRTVTAAVRTLPDLVAAVRDPSWIRADSDTVQLNAALILQPGTVFTIAAPAVRRLLLMDRPGVILGVQTGDLTLRAVAVSSWANGPVTDHTTRKPYPSVVAEHRSVMTINDSTFSGLGWDWNGSYGVSWLSQSTGSVSGSTFEHNFIGSYTDQAIGMRFVNDVFRANLLYGLDPHSFSRDVIISHVTAEGNRGSGIIFSNHVTGGLVEECTAAGNAENGIMMDATSTGNKIQDNIVVNNRGDGIVVSNSPANRFENNKIRGNRVGVHTSGNGADNQVLTGNTVEANVLASQGIALPPNTNTVKSNGGQWLPSRIVFVWGAAVGECAIAAFVTMLLRRRRSRHAHLSGQVTEPKTTEVYD
jgi:mannuronan 5-epimerase